MKWGALRQVAIRRGTAQCWDHAQLVHEQLLYALVQRMSLFIKRVRTDDNIGDIPSREVGHLSSSPLDVVHCDQLQAGVPTLLRQIGARHMAPRLPPGATDKAAWDVLRERWRLSENVCEAPAGATASVVYD